MPDNETALREQLYQLLLGANAHADVLSALKDFPPELYGVKPPNAPHSAWELLEHMRIALRDLWIFPPTRSTRNASGRMSIGPRRPNHHPRKHGKALSGDWRRI